MKHVVIFLFCIIGTLSTYSQEKESIGFEINLNYDKINMMELNERMDQVISNWSNKYIFLDRQKMTEGLDLGLSLNYQISNLFNIGLYGKYISSKSINDYRFIDDSHVFIGEPIDTIYDSYSQRVVNRIIGVFTDFTINNLEFWPKENLLSRIESKIMFGLGYSFSQFNSTSGSDFNNGFVGEVNPVSGMHLMSSLNIGFKLIKRPVFSSIGFRFGYQLLLTESLKKETLITFKEKPPRLNFSGLTAGIYLTFGK